ncbi:MAG: hypothetical protein IPP45_01920 [Sphingomonadales bacterium]|nr:hypothetical protein [Sphingomonadales bacterium]
MTKPKTQLDLGLLTAMVADLTERLAQADADVALLVRLKEAEATAARIRAELQTAQDKRAEAIADAAMQEKMARYASFKDARVDTSEGANALATSYTITIKRLAYNYSTRENDLVERVYHGFESLEADALGYLIDVRPEAIPAILMTLAPGDPAGAMRRYYQAKQRGYLAA